MFRGSLVALVTPMTESGDVDHVAFGRLLDWHAREGSDGVVVGGTTGESATLTAGESAENPARLDLSERHLLLISRRSVALTVADGRTAYGHPAATVLTHQDPFS